MLFPRMVYLANFGTRLHLANVFLVHVPIASVLVQSTCWITPLVHTQTHTHTHTDTDTHTHTHTKVVCLSRMDELCKHQKSGHDTQTNKHCRYIWLVSHLLRVGDALTSVQYMYKCTAPTKWQVSTSDKCLSYTPVWIQWDSHSFPQILRINSRRLRINSRRAPTLSFKSSVPNHL